jgi:hypothetical protein
MENLNQRVEPLVLLRKNYKYPEVSGKIGNCKITSFLGYPADEVITTIGKTGILPFI